MGWSISTPRAGCRNTNSRATISVLAAVCISPTSGYRNSLLGGSEGPNLFARRLTKAIELCRLTGHHVLLLDGPPDVRLYYMVDSFRLREGFDDSITDVV